MNITIKGEKDQEQDDTLELWLERRSGHVYLMGKDNTGVKQFILLITSDGISRIQIVSEGWPIDKSHCFKINN